MNLADFLGDISFSGGQSRVSYFYDMQSCYLDVNMYAEADIFSSPPCLTAYKHQLCLLINVVDYIFLKAINLEYIYIHTI